MGRPGDQAGGGASLKKRFIVFGAPRLERAEEREVLATMRSGWIGTGPRVARFEAAFGRYVGARHAAAVSSGTAALHLAMLASGVGPGDEVVTTPLTFAATANAILHAGATPVFADVDPVTQNLDPGRAAAAVTRKTRALLPVHFAGRPCDMDALGAIARRRRLLVIEDAAHAIEARWRGRACGTIGDLGCFSFYVTKNLTTAEGGMVTTAKASYAETVKTLALHGMTKDAWRRFSDSGYRHYQVVAPGFKYNLIDLHAAIGLRQLPRIERWWRRRRALWAYYTRRFAGLPVALPSADVGRGRHALHLFTVHLDLARLRLDRDGVMMALFRRGVGCGVHYIALHLQPYYRKRFGFRPNDFPVAAWISERTLSLPLSAALTDGEAERVADAFVAVIRGAARAPSGRDGPRRFGSA